MIQKNLDEINLKAIEGYTEEILSISFDYGSGIKIKISFGKEITKNQIEFFKTILREIDIETLSMKSNIVDKNLLKKEVMNLNSVLLQEDLVNEKSSSCFFKFYLYN